MNLFHRKTKKRGFTLIELMVVISIIGLLSSIVLASLTNARRKAQDARLISDMINLRTAAEIYRSTTGSYYYSDVWTSETINCGLNPTSCPSTFLANSSEGGGFKIIVDIRSLVTFQKVFFGKKSSLSYVVIAACRPLRVHCHMFV